MKMIVFVNVFLLITTLFASSEPTSMTSFKASSCSDWTPFKDEKCFKIAIRAGHQTQADAEIVCQSFSEELHLESYPKLISIKTKEEQDFLHQFLFTDSRIQDPVWLGLKEVGNTGEFQWNDGSKTYFTNWANQTVSDDQHRCVVMASGGGIAPIGSWVKVNCEKANRVVCERTQPLTLEIVQNRLFNFKLEQKQKDEKAQKEFEDLKRDANSLKQETISLKQEVTNLKQNPVPIGFIYGQLPEQDAPTTLWPGTIWAEISFKYAGLFFRVVGGKAAPFGQMQEGNSSRLAEVSYTDAVDNHNPLSIPSDGSWSEHIYCGGDHGVHFYRRYRLSNEEVRPRNQAMKLWQRTK